MVGFAMEIHLSDVVSEVARIILSLTNSIPSLTFHREASEAKTQLLISHVFLPVVTYHTSQFLLVYSFYPCIKHAHKHQ